MSWVFAGVAACWSSVGIAHGIHGRSAGIEHLITHLPDVFWIAIAMFFAIVVVSRAQHRRFK